MPMYSNESHVLPGSDYYIYTASALAKKLFFYPVCSGYFKYEPGYCLKRNSYESFLVMLVTKGTCIVTLNGKEMTAPKDSAILLNCYRPHQYETHTGCEILWLHFDGPLCRDYYEHIIRTAGHIIFPRSLQRLEHALRKIYETFRDSGQIQEDQISLYITEILNELLRSDMTENSPDKLRQSLSATISYINEHFTQDISLNDLAKEAALSPYYYTRIFAKETGMTPHQYIIATRINCAKFLLKATALPVKEVAFNSGFSDESSFCTTFKKWEHITPGEYRLQNTAIK